MDVTLACSGSVQDQSVPVEASSANTTVGRSLAPQENGTKQHLCDLWSRGFLEACSAGLQYG